MLNRESTRYLPGSLVLVPLDGVDAGNLLSLVLHGALEVVFRLEILFDDLVVGVRLVNAERRGEIALLPVTAAQPAITKHSMKASHSPSGTIFWSL